MRSDSMPRAVVTCTVISHQPFGLLVELENKEKGMIRIRETSWDANERARWKQHFPLGARLKALIIKQQEGRYVELSARLAEDDPWERIGENFHEGQVVNGTVTGVKHYGAFVEIRPGLTGLLHRSRLPAWCKTNVLDLFWPGDMVKVQILKIDHKQKQISLASAPVTYSDKNAAPLPALRNGGPCPFVKTLYDAGRYVEFKEGRQASANVGYTGEIQQISAGCAYRDAEPIKVRMEILFELGKGPAATGSSKTYRYWVAVTQRNRDVIAKQYFDLPVNFPSGQDRVYATDTIEEITIPRATITTSGANFEVLVGFDVTPEMAEFNRDGKRFRLNAGVSEGAATNP